MKRIEHGLSAALLGLLFVYYAKVLYPTQWTWLKTWGTYELHQCRNSFRFSAAPAWLREAWEVRGGKPWDKSKPIKGTPA